MVERKILILERQRDLGSTVDKYFAQRGFQSQIRVVDSITQAIQMLTNDVIDLVVSNHEVSHGINGLELLDAVRKAGLPVRVVLLVDPALESDHATALTLGCTCFLVKPVPEDKLCDLLFNMLKSHEGFAGRVVGMRLEDIVQMLCYRKDSTLLSVAHNGNEGTIYVHDGGIVHSRCGPVTGVDAFYEILEWDGGEFRSQVIFDVPEKTIFLDWQSLLMEGIRQKDEIRHALSPVPDPNADNQPTDFETERTPSAKAVTEAAVEVSGEPAKRVMIVDDSRFIRKIVQEIVESDSALKVAGYATNGQEALAKIEEIKPDLILLDWDMPVMKGSTALMHIMIRTPCPVVVLSSFVGGVGANPIDLLCLGGVDFLRKPQNNWRLDGRADDLVRRVKQACSIKFDRIRRVKVPPPIPENTVSRQAAAPADFLTILGSSIGGSSDLIRLVPFLPEDLPCAVIAMHDMQQEALPAFVDYLERRSRIEVQPLRSGFLLAKGVCYVHPSNMPVELVKDRNGITVKTQTALQGDTPLDHLLLSASKVLGNNLIAVLLSGGSRQGIKGLRAVRQAGGTTLVEDPASSASPEMAETALREDVVDHVVSAETLAERIGSLVRQSN